jgi:hypothetical protein
MALYLLLVGLTALGSGFVSSDSVTVAGGAGDLAKCLTTGAWAHCRDHNNGLSAVGPFPPLQYLPAIGLSLLGFRDGAVLTGLAWINLLAFAGCMILAVVALRPTAARALAPLAVLGIFLSSGTYQATARFGELLAALTILAMVAAATLRRTVLLLICTALAATSKETAPPFVLALGILAAREASDGWLPSRRLLTPLLIGTVIGTATNAGFNVLRFGTWRNTYYLDPLRHAPPGRVPGFWAAGWLSPAAGIAWYWPITTMVLLFTLWGGIRALHRAPPDPRQWAPPLALVVLMLAWTLGLAMWYTPFGWAGVGPRLSVPLLPAVTVLGCLFAAPHLQAAPSHLPTLRRFIPLAPALAAVVLAALPWDWHSVLNAINRPADACPPLRGLHVGEPNYYPCVIKTMWRPVPSVFIARPRAAASWLGVGLAAVAAGLLAWRPPQLGHATGGWSWVQTARQTSKRSISCISPNHDRPDP